jgi:hypothetical protein
LTDCPDQRWREPGRIVAGCNNHRLDLGFRYADMQPVYPAADGVARDANVPAHAEFVFVSHCPNPLA